MQISAHKRRSISHLVHIIMLTVIKVRGAHRSKVAIEYSWPDALANAAVKAFCNKLTFIHDAIQC